MAMKNVLIPTDFSESANRAASLGTEIAKKLGAGVTFLHLISTPVEWRKIPLEKESLYPETKAAIGDAKDALLKLEKASEKNGVETCSSLIFNTGIEEIQKYIKKESYSLVAMGTHGIKGIYKMIGSNTLKVINSSPVPVLLLKEDSPTNLPQKIALASDFEEESLTQVETLMELAKKLGASVEALFVNTPYNFQETTAINEKLEKVLGHYPQELLHINVINAHNEERGIEMYLKTNKCDLMAIVTHGRSGLTPLYRRSITEALINHLEIPVLSLNT